MTAIVKPAKVDLLDDALVLLFLLGIYLGFAVYLSAGIPLPAALAGVAGLALLVRRAADIRQRHVVALVAVILLYLLSILCASDSRFLFERFKGFVQLSYALIAGYGLFLTLLRYDRDRLARLFLAFAIVILIGCVLENYAGLRPVSDAVRAKLFQENIYESDLRDQQLYGQIRPKLFTSEPSAVTFGFTLFAFSWFALATWRWKLAIYLGLLAAGFLLMRGPTLLLGFLLVIPYELFLAARRRRDGRVRYSAGRLAVTLGLSVLLLAAFWIVGTTFYAERLSEIADGSDASFFYRVIGPALVAFEVVARHPFAGAGLTGEEFIQDLVIQIYTNAPLSGGRYFDRAADVLTNYFWYHWIYLGLGWGLIMIAALTGLLRALGAPSLAFCWIVWTIFGQASGAYVSPKTWSVFMLACVLALLHERQPMRSPERRHAPIRLAPIRSAAS